MHKNRKVDFYLPKCYRVEDSNLLFISTNHTTSDISFKLYMVELRRFRSITYCCHHTPPTTQRCTLEVFPYTQQSSCLVHTCSILDRFQKSEKMVPERLSTVHTCHLPAPNRMSISVETKAQFYLSSVYVQFATLPGFVLVLNMFRLSVSLKVH